MIIMAISVNENNITAMYGSPDCRLGQMKLLHSPSSHRVCLNLLLHIAGLAAYLICSALS